MTWRLLGTLKKERNPVGHSYLFGCDRLPIGYNKAFFHASLTALKDNILEGIGLAPLRNEDCLLQGQVSGGI